MIAAAALIAGWLAGVVLWGLLRDVFSNEVFARSNFRGRTVATGVGLVVVVAVVAVEAARQLLDRLTEEPTSAVGAARTATVLACAGFGLLGLFDDLAGSEDRGFRGHLRALAHGRLTTGGLKLFGGAIVAVASAGLLSSSAGRVLLDAAVIALCANLGNLFDRAPGRTTKVAVLAFCVVAAVAGAPAHLGGPAVAIGAALALVVPDLRERVMLGDAGANVLGAALGLALVLTTAGSATAVTLIVLIALNGASELVSFSRIIERVPPLRAFDLLGREAPPR